MFVPAILMPLRSRRRSMVSFRRAWLVALPAVALAVGGLAAKKVGALRRASAGNGGAIDGLAADAYLARLREEGW